MSNPTNVLLIMSDEHNRRYSSVYGMDDIATPNMERLAARGTVFENGYCPSPLCMPSRCSFMAGRRAHELQTYSNCNILKMDYETYGGLLHRRGVHSVHIGKTDVFRAAEELGFAEMILPRDRSVPGDINFSRTPLKIRKGAAGRADKFGPHDDPFTDDDDVMERAIHWLQNRPEELDSPWTLAVNLLKPHFPHFVTPELWELYPDGDDLPRYGPDEESANHPYARDLRAHFETDKFTEEEIRGLRRGYLGCVTYTDQQIGRLLDALDEEGLNENTLIIYTSDHGEMLGKFGMWWKCSLYEDSVGVPVLAAGPGIEKGARVSTPVDLLDVQASLFEATGTERPDEWTGTPLQLISKDDSERVVFSEYHGHGVRSGGYMIRKGDWKLVHCMDAPHQLFNLAEDPHELNNLADQNGTKLAELQEELRAVCDPEAQNRRAHELEEQQLELIERYLELKQAEQAEA